MSVALECHQRLQIPFFFCTAIIPNRVPNNFAVVIDDLALPVVVILTVTSISKCEDEYCLPCPETLFNLVSPSEKWLVGT
jgi:hypothetical protein